jgi:hypothetical protein
MTTGLPAREFYELAPPEGGSLAVRREAARRRRRQVVVTSGATVVALVGTVLLLQAGGSTGHDSLQITDRPTPVSSASPQVIASGVPHPGSTAAARPGGSGAPVLAGAPQASSSGRPETRPSAVPALYRTPDLVRTYRDRQAPTALTLCSGSSSTTGDGDLQSTVSWCESAVVRPTDRGHDLTGEFCRDDSSDASLTFARQQEVELLVRREDGTVVWRWSLGRSNDASAHSLVVEREHCWSWTAPWTDVDSSGRPLPEGTYELVATSRADELRTAPVARAAFSI